MRSIMSLIVRKLIDARASSASTLRVRVIIIEFVNLISDTADRIRRVVGNWREEEEENKKRKNSYPSRKFLTDERRQEIL